MESMPLTEIIAIMPIKGCPVMQESPQDNVIENQGSDNIEELKKALAEEKAKCEANLAKLLRAQADFVNFKRFAEQDKTEICKYANVNLLINILPVLDDFERALAAIPTEEDEQIWVQGLKMIDRKFRDILEKQGVTRIMALGMEFDPRFMDAITTAQGKRDIVIQEVESGYKLQDKVIRPAKVVVGCGEVELNKEE
jgi:molecular chaperone GrpE